MHHQALSLSFEPVTGTDAQVEILYQLLKHRDFGISHQLMPPHHNHMIFVKNHPYRYWAVVYDNNLPIGTVYLQKNNSIGINVLRPEKALISEILRYIQENFEPAKAIKSKIPAYFYVNVPYANAALNKILLELHATPLQTSYKVSTGMS